MWKKEAQSQGEREREREREQGRAFIEWEEE